MNSRFVVATAGLAALGLVGCGEARKAETPVATTAPAVSEEVTPKVTAPQAEVPVVALVEPFLVAVAAPQPTFLPPPNLRGQILSQPDVAPLTPDLPTETVPIAPSGPSETAPAPSASAKPTPKAPSSRNAIPPAVIRLLEEERARGVDEARARLSAASARATQTAAEAKKQWGFVKEGFVAQKVADAADAAARDAAREQSEAQKALDAAIQRQRDARRDLQAAYGVALIPGFSEVALERPLPAYRPVPFTYRLSLLGTGDKPTVQNGTLGRSLPPVAGEGGAWIVRCVDPAKLRVTVAGKTASLVRHHLPKPPAPTTTKA